MADRIRQPGHVRPGRGPARQGGSRDFQMSEGLRADIECQSQQEMATSRTQVFFRDAQVVQEKLVDQPGLSFLFQINGVRMFCGGSNWIPGDNFLTEMPPQRYKDWVALLVQGNQNMLRIWGGGVYENPALYE